MDGGEHEGKGTGVSCNIKHHQKRPCWVKQVPIVPTSSAPQEVVTQATVTDLPHSSRWKRPHDRRAMTSSRHAYQIELERRTWVDGNREV